MACAGRRTGDPRFFFERDVVEAGYGTYLAHARDGPVSIAEVTAVALDDASAAWAAKAAKAAGQPAKLVVRP